MSEILSAVGGIAFQCLIFAGAVFAVIGLYDFFCTTQYVNWPWKMVNTGHFDNVNGLYRKGVVAGVYYYTLAHEAHAPARQRDINNEFQNYCEQVLKSMPPEQRETFSAAMEDGRRKIEDVVTSCRHDVVYRHFPAFQSTLADTSKLVNHCAANVASDLVPAMAKVKDNIDKLRGLQV